MGCRETCDFRISIFVVESGFGKSPGVEIAVLKTTPAEETASRAIWSMILYCVLKTIFIGRDYRRIHNSTTSTGFPTSVVV
jgi:hypothetical protein